MNEFGSYSPASLALMGDREIQELRQRLEMEALETDRQRYRDDVAAFVSECCQVHDKAAGRWLPFHLWPSQQDLLRTIINNRNSVCLKSRQLGWTWCVLGYVLHLVVFRGSTALLFSQRDDDAQELMDRLVAMYHKLPEWLRPAKVTSSRHELKLTNQGQALAFPTTGRAGRSYTGAFALVDEADFVDDLPALLNSMQPAVDAGGQLVLLSTSNKSKPESIFKRIYLNAVDRKNEYTPIFHGWDARPGRTAAWYADKVKASLANTGALDDVWQEYPATSEEALAPRSLDKRLPYEWLKQCYVAMTATEQHGAPAINGLKVYLPPQKGNRYVIGADPAQGNPTSDDSALEVFDVATGEEVAVLAGKFEPSTFGSHIKEISRWYNTAPALAERNNHGHAVLLWLADSGVPLLKGPDDNPGWQTTIKSKAEMYAKLGETLRDGDCRIHDPVTLAQLASVEGSTLKAPEGQHDDRAIAFGLGIVAVVKSRGQEWVFGGSNPREAEFARMPGGDPTLDRLERGWNGDGFGGGE